MARSTSAVNRGLFVPTSGSLRKPRIVAKGFLHLNLRGQLKVLQKDVNLLKAVGFARVRHNRSIAS